MSATSNAGVKESSDASFNAAISQVMLCLDIPSLTKLLKNPFATPPRSLPIRDRAEPLTVVVRQMVVALRVVFANARPDSENPTVQLRQRLRMFKSKSTNIPKGVPPGNVVEVTWTSVGGAKKIDVLLNVPGQDAPIVLTTAKRYPNENKILVTMPTEIAGGDGFTVSVYHATGLSGTSDPFKVSDACAYVSCGTNGQCVDGKCECLNFYSGDSCRISPCAAAGCLSFAPGVDTCDVDVNGTVTCGCNEGFVGEKCQHPQGCENHCQNGGIANPGLIETTVNGAQNINCGTCTCPQGTAFTGDKCQTCPLECQGGKPNDSCTGCVCEKGWAGSQCQCGQFIITMQMKANENMRATDSILKTIIEHDIMKAIFEDVPDFDGSVQDVAYKSCGGDCIEVTFNLREKCLATPLGRRLSWAIPRRLSSDAVKSAYDAVYAQSKDKWSVLRAHGIVTSTFDASFGIKAEDPTGRHDLETDNGLGMAALIGIIVGCVALFSVLGFFLVKNDMIGNPFNSISESLERRRKKRQSLKLNDTSHSQIEIKHMDKQGGTQTYNRPGFTSAMGTSYSNKSGFPAMPQQMTMPPGVSSKQMVSNPMATSTSTSSRTTYKKQTSQLSAYQPKPTKPTLEPRPQRRSFHLSLQAGLRWLMKTAVIRTIGTSTLTRRLGIVLFLRDLAGEWAFNASKNLKITTPYSFIFNYYHVTFSLLHHAKAIEHYQYPNLL